MDQIRFRKIEHDLARFSYNLMEILAFFENSKKILEFLENSTMCNFFSTNYFQTQIKMRS